MASLCNYSHPDPRLAQGLVEQGAGRLFPYNPEFYDNASGLYGPGAIYCWYMLLASVLASWSFYLADHGSLKERGLSSDLIGALAYPVFAATDLLLQSIPRFGNVEIDLHHIPPDKLDFGQRVVNITGPLTICYTATTFLFLLYILFCSNLCYAEDWKPIPVVRWLIYAVCGYILLILTVFHLSLDNWVASYVLFFIESTLPIEFALAYMLTFTTTIGSICFLVMLVWAEVDKDRGQATEALKWVACIVCFVILLAAPSMMVIRRNELSIIPDLGIRVSERDQLATLIVGVFTLSLTLFDIGQHFYREFYEREGAEEDMGMLTASEA